MATEKLVIKSKLTGQTQTVTPEEFKIIDPHRLRFTVEKEVATPPEAKAAEGKTKKD